MPSHWSSPDPIVRSFKDRTIVFENEPFFGRDRIDFLRGRLERKHIPHRDWRLTGWVSAWAKPARSYFRQLSFTVFERLIVLEVNLKNNGWPP